MEYRLFKGTSSEYRALHYWVERQLGKPSHCVNCGDATKRRYHWANISGNYLRDVKDWERLCVPCHTKKDRKDNRLCKRGHEMKGNNLGHKLMHGCLSRYCKPCANIHAQDFRNRNKVLYTTSK